MKDLSKLIGECITPAAVDHKIKFYSHHGVRDEVLFWSNIEKNLSNYIDSKVRERRFTGSSHAGSWGMTRNLGTPQPFDSCLDEPLQKIKSTYEAIRELRESLTGNGECTYESDFKDKEDFSTPYLEGLKSDIEENGEWRLQENLGEINYWNRIEGKRVYDEFLFHRLLHNDGSHITFDLPEENDPIIHAQMFFICPQYQGNYFYTRKRFKFCFNSLCVHRGLTALHSPCLMKHIPDAKTRTGEDDDWRFKNAGLKGSNSDVNRLMLLWLRLGAIRPMIEDGDPYRLFFVNPSHAEEFKMKLIEVLGRNPFKYIKRSLYDKDLEDKLLDGK